MSRPNTALDDRHEAVCFSRTSVRRRVSAKTLGARNPLTRKKIRIGHIRTAMFLTSGLLLMASVLNVARLFSEHFPWAPNLALALSLGVWLAVTGANMWIGVSKAGCSAVEELPILILLFGVPAAAAVLARWRFF